MKVLELHRRAKNLSQEDLGKRILYSRSVISRLETENLSPAHVHPRLRAGLEQFFGESLERLLAPVDVTEN